jgi:hypothetical protein
LDAAWRAGGEAVSARAAGEPRDDARAVAEGEGREQAGREDRRACGVVNARRRRRACARERAGGGMRDM